MAMNAMPYDDGESPVAYDVDECSICREGYTSIAEKTFLPCAHYFHKDCIEQWLVAHDSCPVCSTFTKEDSFPADAHVPDDDDNPEDADAAFLLMDNAQLLHQVQQVANIMQPLGLHMERYRQDNAQLLEHIKRQWGQNMQYNVQLLEHNIQQLEQTTQRIQQHMQLFLQYFFPK